MCVCLCSSMLCLVLFVVTERKKVISGIRSFFLPSSPIPCGVLDNLKERDDENYLSGGYDRKEKGNSNGGIIFQESFIWLSANERGIRSFTFHVPRSTFHA
ncbi:unnamed protein product, partial [Pylaiella littoralis]